MAKTKMKTRSAAKRRLKVTGTNKITRRKAGQSHLMEKKSQATKRDQKVASTLTKGNLKNARKMLSI